MGRIALRELPVLTAWERFLPPPPAAAERESAYRAWLQATPVQRREQRVYCQVTRRQLSPSRCFQLQYQPGCFGCGAATHCCHICLARPVAVPELELCAECLGPLLALELRRGALVLEPDLKVRCPREKRQIRVRDCRRLQAQNRTLCAGCPQSSRYCEQDGCNLPVCYPDDGYCRKHAIAAYGKTALQEVASAAGQFGYLDGVLARLDAGQSARLLSVLGRWERTLAEPTRPARSAAVDADLVARAAAVMVADYQRAGREHTGQIWLSRQLGISQDAAGKLHQPLEQLGVLGPKQPGKRPRKLLVSSPEQLQRVLAANGHVQPVLAPAVKATVVVPPPQLREAVVAIRRSGSCSQLTIREHLGVSDLNVVRAILAELEALGIVGPDRGQPRGRKLLKTHEEMGELLRTGFPSAAPPTPPSPFEQMERAAAQPLSQPNASGIADRLKALADAAQAQDYRALAQLLRTAAAYLAAYERIAQIVSAPPAPS
ncbi:MAG: hypothetical protein G01um101431_1020 [Parcubacteria group bacterium Gr01-1014_31]|nr:MAG: hypothetical protein G01um101431_1020 [Parcubacteria group bacterium Gr01-1014_31]